MLGESGPEHHAAAVADPVRVHLVLDDGAGPVGYLSLAAPRGPEPGVELHRLVVAADRRRTGLGRALLHLALDLCGVPRVPESAPATAAPGTASPGTVSPGTATPRCPEGHPGGAPGPESAPGSIRHPARGDAPGHTTHPERHPRSAPRPEGAPGGNGTGTGNDAGTGTGRDAGRGTGTDAGTDTDAGKRGRDAGVVLDPGWTPPGWLTTGRIWLEVAPGNTAALRLYRAAGFVTETQLPSVPGDPASPPLRLILSRG